MKNKANNETSIGVVLNGGSNILDNATVPIMFGFNQEIIEQAPTHVLVLDFSEKEQSEAEEGHSYNAKRRIIDLRQPVNFIEFLSSGKHQLLFWFLKFNNESQVAQFEKHILSRTYSAYELTIALQDPKTFIDRKSQAEYICSAEKMVEIPKIFFAQKPQSQIGKIVYKWSNRWYKTKPIDQCDYRRRRILAFTLQPLAELLHFLLRLLIVSLMSVIHLVVSFLVLFIGGTNSSDLFTFFPNVWFRFLLAYPRVNWREFFSDNLGDTFNSCYYKYRQINLGRKEIKIWFTPFQVLSLLFFQFLFLSIVSAPRLFYGGKETTLAIIFLIISFTLVNLLLSTDKDKSYSNSDLKVRRILSILELTVNIAALSVLLIKIIGRLSGHLWLSCGVAIIMVILIIWAIKLLKIKNAKTDSKKTERQANKEEMERKAYLEYLKASYDLSKLPGAINLKNVPGAYSGFDKFAQKFKVSYWGAKAKVCKPFEY